MLRNNIEIERDRILLIKIILMKTILSNIVRLK